MIIVKEVSKQFDRKLVVDGISLTIKQGEIVGLLGPNGAGKTTTLRMIAGVLPPTKGSIEIDGLDSKQKYNEVKKHIGFLPENNPLYDDLTVEEYLSFWTQIKGLGKEKKREAIDFVVEHCGIADVYYRPISELSKGYKQRVGLAQAILAKPEILILDEPTEGLDPNQRQDIAKLIQSLGKQRTVIISSHVLSEIAKLCNRMVIIHKGAIVADNTPDKLRSLKTRTQTVEVEIKGEKILENLRAIPDVVKVSKVREGYYSLEAKKNADIREAVFKTAVKKKWVLLTMIQKQRDLEDIFSRLTSK